MPNSSNNANECNSLEHFIENVCSESHLRIETDFGDGFVRLKSAEAERRQAIHDIRFTEDAVIELLRNARDAHAKHIFVATVRENRQRILVTIDDGDGIPLHLHNLIFEPRVTSKLDSMHKDKWGVHGRGMALYSIAANAQASYVSASDVDKGSSFVIKTDLSRLGEKTDQSSFPVFERTEMGTVAVRGPKNILRTACEFALDCHRTCKVYLGSIIDIAATLYAFGLSLMTSTERVFCPSVEELPICKRLAVSSDPASFSQQANLLGLELSERSARRIMDGEITPLSPLTDRIHIVDKGKKQISKRKTVLQKTKPYTQDERGLKIAPDDLKTLSREITHAFQGLARDYYLESDVEPEIRITKNGIHISIPVIKML